MYKKINTAIKSKTGKDNARTSETARANEEISRGMLISISAVGGLIGAWSAACFISGLIASGGPLSFLKSFFTAVTGS